MVDGSAAAQRSLSYCSACRLDVTVGDSAARAATLAAAKDAAATAHYRLGIGINSALSALPWLRAALGVLMGNVASSASEAHSGTQLRKAVQSIVRL